MLKPKLMISSILIIAALLLSSCSLGESRTEMLSKDNDDKVADARLEQVIEAIQNQDKDALKAMFSKQALAEAKGLDQNMDYLFELFQGEVKSKDDDGGPQVSESNDHGHVTKEVKSFYTVETDKQKYFFFLLEYTEDTDHPDNVGLYTLRVIKAEDEETQYSSWQKMKIAGIYKPVQ